MYVLTQGKTTHLSRVWIFQSHLQHLIDEFISVWATASVIAVSVPGTFRTFRIQCWRFLLSRPLHNLLFPSAALGISCFSSESLLLWPGALLISAEGKTLFSQRCRKGPCVPQGCHLSLHRLPGLGLGQVRFQWLCQIPLEVVPGLWTVCLGKQV